MPRITQDGKFLHIDSPLGTDTLIGQSLTGDEAVNELFRFQLDAISPIKNISRAQLLNATLKVYLSDREGGKRWFHGIVSNFAMYGRTRGYDSGDVYYRYRIEIVPKMWLMSQGTECRIFQKIFTKDIIQQVLAEHGIQPRSMPSDPGRKWDTCVQYMESDFTFVSRLMEEEGYLYFHTMSQNAHDLYITDSTSHYPQLKSTVFMGHKEDQDYLVETWELAERILPNSWETHDFSYKKVSAANNKVNSVLPSVTGGIGVVDYPGAHADNGRQSTHSRRRMEALEVGGSVATGHGFCWWFSAGSTFRLEDKYDDTSAEWVVARVHHIASDPTELSGEGAPMYSNSFTCMEKTTVLRPQRKTPRPVIAGTQTAIVTVAQAQISDGGDGDEKALEGAVKVKFHWVNSRSGTRGQQANSCWVRVAQPFAGKKFGFQYVPQVDDEVIVSFMDGDPDNPIIIGSVHNGKNPYPWSLPANWTQSGFRTRASAGGKYSGESSNVLRFEDKGGSEEIWTHAAKDQRREVTNNDRLDVGNDQTEDIVGHRDVTIHKTDTLTVTQKITIVCGQSKITMTPTDITIESVTINIKASGVLTSDAPMHNVKASGLLVLQAPLIKIN
ncbi:MAG TPA: type VI secretion system tip protein TssI/VgrG [Vineibacter sp.]|nr:type VI secretion system tip protein TssI/VgrG [Vineibacter sp.]